MILETQTELKKKLEKNKIPISRIVLQAVEAVKKIIDNKKDKNE